MAVLSARQLLDQADRLVATSTGGRPTQIDLRRAISSAYYAAFHTIVTDAADEFWGNDKQRSPEHALIMRSIDHATIRKTCEELARSHPPARYAAYLPSGGLEEALKQFMEAFPPLQQQRHAADYDSLSSYTPETARGVIESARAALEEYWRADVSHRRVFLFPPRR